MLRTFYLLMLFLLPVAAVAGSPDSGAIRVLDTQRIYTNMTGMSVLGSWGLLNMTAGIAGAITAPPGESRHFHQMNAVWGVVNVGIAGLGFLGARRELMHPGSMAKAVQRYGSTRRLYLINAGLDVFYIGTGAYLTGHAKGTDGKNAELYRGFGKSLILQGAGLLLFDAAMYAAHARNAKGWQRALQGVTFTGDGIGWRYAIR